LRKPTCSIATLRIGSTEAMAAMESLLSYWRSQLIAPSGFLHCRQTVHGPQHWDSGGPVYLSIQPRPDRRRSKNRFAGNNRHYCNMPVLLVSRSCWAVCVTGGRNCWVHLAAKAQQELEPILGYFSNTVAFRADLSGNPKLREFLSRVKDVTIGALSHAELPFQEIVREMHPLRDGGAPIFRTLFSMAPRSRKSAPNGVWASVISSTATRKRTWT